MEDFFREKSKPPKTLGDGMLLKDSLQGVFDIGYRDNKLQEEGGQSEEHKKQRMVRLNIHLGRATTHISL